MANVPLASLSLINTANKPELFARKVVVLAYTLEPTSDGQVTPNFLFTIIAPKQHIKTLKEWNKSKKFRLPSGHSLIKGTREMIYAGERFDVPPGFGRYFNPQSWDQDFKVDTGHSEIMAKIDGLMPVASTALSESREEAGIKTSFIKQLIDLGAYHFVLDGQERNYHCIGMELKSKKNAKAKDSLALNYFTYQELKKAQKVRFRYNIPLVRPSHFLLIKHLRKTLKAVYVSQGIPLTYKTDVTDWDEKLGDLKKQFKGIIKQASKGRFCSYKGTYEKTTRRILKRSKTSRTKVKRLQKLVR